jgi:predicted nucleic acid-binding protein
MPIVISDASPLHYLVLVGEAEVLHRLYGQVLVPLAVIEELQRGRTPTAVRSWVSDPPSWLEIVKRGLVVASGLGLELLGDGEREAIALALNQHADMLLMDDREGVEKARSLGLTVTGTLGVLQRAAERRLLDLPQVIMRLQSTNFRASPEVIRALLEQNAGRKK